MSIFVIPAGMTRRHFLAHLAGASALALPADRRLPTRLRPTPPS